MKCPQRHRFISNDQGGHDDVFLPCLKEDCAWWLEDVQMCSIKELALEVRYCQYRLQERNESARLGR